MANQDSWCTAGGDYVPFQSTSCNFLFASRCHSSSEKWLLSVGPPTRSASCVGGEFLEISEFGSITDGFSPIIYFGLFSNWGLICKIAEKQSVLIPRVEPEKILGQSYCFANDMLAAKVRPPAEIIRSGFSLVFRRWNSRHSIDQPIWRPLLLG